MLFLHFFLWFFYLYRLLLLLLLLLLLEPKYPLLSTHLDLLMMPIIQQLRAMIAAPFFFLFLPLAAIALDPTIVACSALDSS